MPPDVSTFDADTFMATEVEGAFETKYTPIPTANYTATIDSVLVRAAGDGVVLDVTCLIHDEELAAKLGLERITVRAGIWLDLDPRTGALLFGPNRNIKLGRLREAVGQNGPKPWSFKMLEGAGPLLIAVVPDKSGDYNDIKSYAKLPT
ncbi:MAG: hypothetical protein ACE5HV_00300 [Acidobacteriota bacterium]